MRLLWRGKCFAPTAAWVCACADARHSLRGQARNTDLWVRQRSKVSLCHRFVLCASWLVATFTFGTARVGRALPQQLPHQLTASMSRRGNCWDSGCSETLFGSLTVERLNDQRFSTRRHAKDETFAWLLWYNRSWLPFTLNCVSLMQFEQHWLADQAKRASSQPRLFDRQFEGKIRP